MQKIIGSILILIASTGIGVLKGMDLKKHLKELQSLKQIFLMLRSEIKCTKTPLGEAFSHIGRRMEGIYGRWLLSVARQAEEKSEKSFWELWNRSVEESFTETKLKKAEVEQLKAFGRNIGCLDEELQIGMIELYLEQLDMEIQQSRESLEIKKRLYHCLGVMGGIFLVIIFI